MIVPSTRFHHVRMYIAVYWDIIQSFFVLYKHHFKLVQKSGGLICNTDTRFQIDNVAGITQKQLVRCHLIDCIKNPLRHIV